MFSRAAGRRRCAWESVTTETRCRSSCRNSGIAAPIGPSGAAGAPRSLQDRTGCVLILRDAHAEHFAAASDLKVLTFTDAR